MYYNRDGTRFKGDVIEWAAAFEMKDRKVNQTYLWNGYYVSTIFLGMDHSFGMGPPVIFETMVFFQPGKYNVIEWVKRLLGKSVRAHAEQDMQRYSSEQGATIGHEIMVEKWRRRFW